MSPYGRGDQNAYSTMSHTDDGSGSVEITSHGWGKGLRISFWATANKKYTFSAYVKMQDSNLGQNLYFVATPIAGNGVYWNASKVDEWEEVVYQFVPKSPNGIERSVYVDLYMTTMDRSLSTTKNSGTGLPDKVKDDASNLDRSARIFLDDLKIVQSDKLIPREPRTPKKAFDSSSIRVDGLGNFTVKEGSSWKAIFPKMIYRDSGNGDNDQLQYAAFADYGFNGIIDIRNKAQVEKGLSVGLKYFGVVAPNQASQFEDGSSFDTSTKALIKYVNEDLGKPYTLLFYNHDNENSAIQDHDGHELLASYVDGNDKDLVDDSKRARPIYFLNGHEGLARSYNNNNRVQMDIMGTYVADKDNSNPALRTYNSRPHETLTLADRGQNQIAPVTMIQLQAHLAEKLIPSLFFGIIQGGKGISIWRDGGSTGMKFQDQVWAPRIKDTFGKIDQMMPIIREAHWTNDWTADIINNRSARVNIGTRNHDGEKYLILSNHSDKSEAITINLTGVEASSVEDYFTHAKVADVDNNLFTITVDCNNSGFVVLKINDL